MSEVTTRIFAYGTLMEGFGNNTVLPRGYRVREAYAPGLLFGSGIPFFVAHERPLYVGSPAYSLDMSRQNRPHIRMLAPDPETPHWVKGQLFEWDGLVMGEYALRCADRLEGWQLPRPGSPITEEWGGYRRALIRVWAGSSGLVLPAWSYICDPKRFSAEHVEPIPSGDFRAYDEMMWSVRTDT